MYAAFIFCCPHSPHPPHPLNFLSVCSCLVSRLLRALSVNNQTHSVGRSRPKSSSTSSLSSPREIDICHCSNPHQERSWYVSLLEIIQLDESMSSQEWVFCLILLISKMNRSDVTDHYGVNVTLVAGEGLDAVGAPDVPQLGRRVARPRHKRFLRGNYF